MKLKGINQFEQHVEKVLFGAAIVIAGGIVAWQFLSAPTAKVGSQTVTPGEVDGRLRARAIALREKLENDSVSLEGLSTDPVAPEFEKALRGSVSPRKELARISPNFNGRLVKSVGAGSSEAWYLVPTIPALQMLGVTETADALPIESAKAAKAVSPVIAARPDFAEIDGPRDIVWTTPFARIDLKGLRAAMAAADPSATPPRAAVPAVWYQETPYVVDIVFERREQRPDGTWGEPVTVPVFADRPEELGFRGKVENAPIELRDEVFALLGSEANQREVLQPSFYDTVNDAFVSPIVEAEAGTAAASGEDMGTEELRAQRRRLQLKTELQGKQRRADSLLVEINTLGGLWDDELEKKREKEDKDRKKDEERGSGSGGAPGGGGGGLGGAMGGKNNQDDANAARDERKRQQDRKTKSSAYKRLLSEIAAIEKELGVEPSAKGAAASKAPTLASMDEVLAWAHDMEVVPGRTYQYRAVARVYNPFFGKGNQLVRDQDATGISGRFTLDSVASAWSSEITVSPKVRFFVSRSSLGDGLAGSGSAQVEVYVLQGGRWRRDDVSVSPGERIGGVEASGSEQVDFTTDYFLLDIVEDLDPKRAGGAGRKLGVAIVAPVGGGTPEIRVPAAELASPDRLKKRMLAESATVTESPVAPKQGGGGTGG